MSICQMSTRFFLFSLQTPKTNHRKPTNHNDIFLNLHTFTPFYTERSKTKDPFEKFRNMVESAPSLTEQLVECLQQTNKALLDISRETLLSGFLKDKIPESSKDDWLGEAGLIHAFRESFKSLRIDEKLKELEEQENEDKRVTVPKLMKKEYELMQEEKDKLVNKGVSIESKIYPALDDIESKLSSKPL